MTGCSQSSICVSAALPKLQGRNEWSSGISGESWRKAYTGKELQHNYIGCILVNAVWIISQPRNLLRLKTAEISLPFFFSFFFFPRTIFSSAPLFFSPLILHSSSPPDSRLRALFALDTQPHFHSLFLSLMLLTFIFSYFDMFPSHQPFPECHRS